MKGLVLALAMFSVTPVPSGRVPVANRTNAARALRWLPLVGALLGALAGAVALIFWRGDGRGSPLLAAVVVITVLAAGTRGLHLDGLADLADGLGSRRPPEGALAIMKQSDIGPFGVVAVLLVLLLQIAGLGAVFAVLHPAQVVLVCAVLAASGRLAVLGGAAPAIASARPGGFGALVTGTAPIAVRTSITAVVLLGVGGLGALVGFGWPGLLALIAAVLAGQVAALLLLRHAVRRLGGITGDVFGALIESATTATALVLAGVVTWHGAL